MYSNIAHQSSSFRFTAHNIPVARIPTNQSIQLSNTTTTTAVMALESHGESLAFKLANERHSFLICGEAGTGKTHLLDSLIQQFKEEKRSVVVTCSTGLACMQLFKHGARTIHSTFGLMDGRRFSLKGGSTESVEERWSAGHCKSHGCFNHRWNLHG